MNQEILMVEKPQALGWSGAGEVNQCRKEVKRWGKASTEKSEKQLLASPGEWGKRKQSLSGVSLRLQSHQR